MARKTLTRTPARVLRRRPGSAIFFAMLASGLSQGVVMIFAVVDLVRCALNRKAAGHA